MLKCVKPPVDGLAQKVNCTLHEFKVNFDKMNWPVLGDLRDHVKTVSYKDFRSKKGNETFGGLSLEFLYLMTDNQNTRCHI